MSEKFLHKLIMIKKKNHLSIYERGTNSEICSTDTNIIDDQTKELKEYPKDLDKRTLHKIRLQAHNFTLLDGELYIKGLYGFVTKMLIFS